MKASLALLAFAPQTLDAGALAQVVDAFFERELEEQAIPGAAFALVAEGRVVHLAGYGLADLERRTPVDPEKTVFRVGSISKTVTAAAALQLVERGVLDLHADVNELLDGVDVPATFAEPVTLFHLLTHTAGFDERLLGQHARRPADCAPLRAYLAERLPRRFAPPGRVIAYNDHGTSLAGLLVEQAAGRPFAAHVREELFAPLDMQHTSFEQVELPDTMREHLAVAYGRRGAGHRALARDYVQTTPAAGLYTSAGDMARFLRVLLGGGAADGVRVLGEETVRSMLAVQFRHGPEMRGRAFGWVELDAGGRLALKKSGQASGFSAQLYLLPGERVGWFSVFNLSILSTHGVSSSLAGLHDRLAEELLATSFPAPDPAADERVEPPPVPERFEERASRFVGTYRDVANPRDTWDRALLVDELRVERDGPGALRFLGLGFVEVAPSTFQYEQGGPHFARFVEDDSGDLRWVTWHAGAWERVPWYGTLGFVRATAGPLCALLASAPLVAGVLALRGRRRGRRACPGARATVLAAALLLGFAASFGLALFETEVQTLFAGPTPLMLALLALPPLASVAAAAAAVRLALGPRAHRGAMLERAYYGAVLLGCSAALLLLHEWNLFGWRL